MVPVRVNNVTCFVHVNEQVERHDDLFLKVGDGVKALGHVIVRHVLSGLYKCCEKLRWVAKVVIRVAELTYLRLCKCDWYLLDGFALR